MSNRYSGNVGPAGVIMETGQTLEWRSDDGVTGQGFIVCGDEIQPPPFPGLPPFAPLPSGGIIRELPRVDVNFPIVPVNESTTDAEAAFLTALMSASGCNATATANESAPVCEITVSAVQGSQEVYGRVRPILSVKSPAAHLPLTPPRAHAPPSHTVPC